MGSARQTAISHPLPAHYRPNADAAGGEMPRGPASGGAREAVVVRTRGGRVAVRAVLRRGDAEVAPERLGELRRLAVADAVGDLADGVGAARREQVGGALHPDAGEVLAERRPADL